MTILLAAALLSTSVLCAAIAAAALDATVRSALIQPSTRVCRYLSVPAWPALPSAILFLLVAVASVLQAASWIPSAIHAIAARSRQIILAGLAGRLANNLHAVAIITKYRADERLALLRREALEAGCHDSQARAARLDGCGLERGELR